MNVENRVALTNDDRKFWRPRPEVLNWLEATIPSHAKVLDIGPGTAPFHRADMFVDWTKPSDVPENKFCAVDIHREQLPFEDKTFDFVYCRHVLEDLYDPFRICSEMWRVARAGYIETPSPLAEVCRGIDGGAPPWRGYHHHRYLIWSYCGVLHFLTKYPIIEFVGFDNEAAIPGRLRDNARYWNTHFLWQDKFEVRYFQHEVDYRITENYAAMVTKAIDEHLEATDEFSKLIATAQSI